MEEEKIIIEEQKIMVPPIKSQGKKTKLANWIITELDELKSKNTLYIEPFIGTGVIGFNFMPNRAIFSDTNIHLINFYNDIKNKKIDSKLIRDYLEEEGSKLFKTEGRHYYDVRKRFNEEHSSLDFLFLTRSCFNGMMRFNQKGGFNVPFCKKPNRFAPALVTKIVNQTKWLESAIHNNDWIFKVSDFRQILNQNKTKGNVLYYLDAPYILRHGDYYNQWKDEDEMDLFRGLSEQKGKFVLSTWLGNSFRKNPYVEKCWSSFELKTMEHTYHVGAKEKNRNKITEAIIIKK